MENSSASKCANLNGRNNKYEKYILTAKKIALETEVFQE